jgi:hypothetical protein
MSDFSTTEKRHQVYIALNHFVTYIWLCLLYIGAREKPDVVFVFESHEQFFSYLATVTITGDSAVN